MQDLVVYTDHDNNAAFDGYKTYFLPDSILEAGGYKASYWKDENAKALVDAVAQQMDSRGYTRLTDPEKKDQADVGVQLSYVAQTNHVVSYPSYGGWWDYGFWGPWWGGWYYPYPVSYSYDTQTMLIEMVDLTKKGHFGSEEAGHSRGMVCQHVRIHVWQRTRQPAVVAGRCEPGL